MIERPEVNKSDRDDWPDDRDDWPDDWDEWPDLWGLEYDEYAVTMESSGGDG